jgi:hypothetical protein
VHQSTAVLVSLATLVDAAGLQAADAAAADDAPDGVRIGPACFAVLVRWSRPSLKILFTGAAAGHGTNPRRRSSRGSRDPCRRSNSIRHLTSVAEAAAKQ